MSDEPAPSDAETPSEVAVPTPGAVRIYTMYRVGMIAFYLGFVVLGGWAYATDLNPDEGGPFMGLTIAIVGLLCAALNAASFLVPRKPWAWNVHLVLIALGVIGVVSTPCALLVALLWFRRDTLSYFGQRPK